MIGQTKNIKLINDLIINNKLPHFMLISGKERSGKKELVNEIVKKIGYQSIRVGQSIDDIRGMIQMIYLKNNFFIYIIYGLENYNYRAIEAILKICEEPPVNCYLIITVNNENVIKETIKNRAFMIKMENYNYIDIAKFGEDRNIVIKENLFDLINTPSLVLYFEKRLKDYEFFLSKFLKLNKTSLSNSLKAVSYFNIKKEDTENIDFLLFLNLLIVYFVDRRGKYNLMKLIELINSYQNNYYINGINRHSLITLFIIDFRKWYIEESNK